MSEASTADTATRVAAILVDVWDVYPDAVTPEAHFSDDLEFDSLDVFELVLVVEEEFGIEIGSEEIDAIETVGGVTALIDLKLNHGGQ